MKVWKTDASIEADTRYSRIVKWFAVRGFYRLASLAMRVGL
jgi:hypothetical protein